MRANRASKFAEILAFSIAIFAGMDPVKKTCAWPVLPIGLDEMGALRPLDFCKNF
jgi:hypothetical protein